MWTLLSEANMHPIGGLLHAVPRGRIQLVPRDKFDVLVSPSRVSKNPILATIRDKLDELIPRDKFDEIG